MKYLTRLAVVIVTLTAQSALANAPLMRINNDACLTQTGQAGIDACTSLTAAIGRDLHRLNANARVLEELGRHESAAQMYTAAAAYFPSSKRALQGLVRSRANARASRIITDLTPRPVETSPCWTERWMRALTACQQESQRHVDDARLQERLGDVARSVGDVAIAQAAYSRSLRLQPENPNLYRKQRALSELLAGSSRVPLEPASSARQNNAQVATAEIAETFAPARTAATNVTATTVNAATVRAAPAPTSDAMTIRQLELLEALKTRNLVSASEYEDRRASLLTAAFATPSTDKTVARYRGLHEGRFFAVVIGNDEYASFPELKTAVADADAVSSLLAARYGFEVTTLINADRYQILTALSALRRKAKASDSILLYYAGHGLLDEAAGRGYWLPVDAERDNFAQWISTNDIAGVFAGSDARHALVVADSCFAGSLLRSADGTGIETLQRLASKRSRTVLTSGGLEPVVDDGDGTHSVFASALLSTLAANETVLEASKLFAAVRDRVVRNADQTPQYAPMQTAGHDGGDFLFIPKTLSRQIGTHQYNREE